ncbi:MAG: DUF6356 family protein [Pseudomonadota bacterium]
MKFLVRPFTKHPRSVGESYLQHMRTAFAFSWAMFSGAFACLIHGVFPFLCARTGSQRIDELHRRMVTARRPLKDAVKSHV